MKQSKNKKEKLSPLLLAGILLFVGFSLYR